MTSIDAVRLYLKSNLIFLQTLASIISLVTTAIGWISISGKIKKLQRSHLKSNIKQPLTELESDNQTFLNASSSKATNLENFHRIFSTNSNNLRDSLRKIEEVLDDKELIKMSKNIRIKLDLYSHLPLRKRILHIIPTRYFTNKELNHTGFNISSDVTKFVKLIEIRISHSKVGIPDV